MLKDFDFVLFYFSDCFLNYALGVKASHGGNEAIILGTCLKSALLETQLKFKY